MSARNLFSRRRFLQQAGSAALMLGLGAGDGDGRENGAWPERGLFRSLSSAHWAEIAKNRLYFYSATSKALVLDQVFSIDDLQDDLQTMGRDPRTGQLSLHWAGQLTPEILTPAPAWPDAPRLSGWSRLLSDRALSAAAFWELVERHHINVAALEARRDEMRKALLSATPKGRHALFAAMVEVLEMLDDGHGALWRSWETGEGRSAPGDALRAFAAIEDWDDPEDAEPELLENGADRITARRRRFQGGQASGGRIQWWMEGGFGRLSVSALDDLSESGDERDEVEAADAAFAIALESLSAAGARGLVVDLRLNGGGYDRAGMQLVHRLTDRTRPLFNKRTRHDGRVGEPMRISVSPAQKGVRFTGPVAVLQSGMTVSAAEVTSLALGALPQSRSFGWNSYGAFSDTMSFRLPNGWRGTLSNEGYQTLDGRDFERIGAPPDAPSPAIQPRGDFWAQFDAPIAAAEAWLRDVAG